jgi:beta-N-acetylhexosaminidase
VTSLPLGQLFVFGFEGLEINAEVKSLLSDDGLAGAILFARNIESLEQVVALNRSLTELGTHDYPTLLSVDQEGGRVARLRGICTDVPPMRVIGDLSVDDPDLPYRLGAMMAREVGALGFHLDFAPVLDVDTNPANPVIGDRSFSRDQHLVASLGASFIRGMQEAGIAACAKHFPGHGDTDTDSHLDLPYVSHDKKRIENVELVPFQSAIDVNVASIMTAHIMLPALDAEHPATLSKNILQGILRQKLRYQGLIVSDDLEMKAVADRYSIRELVKQGLLAGVDLFLICKDLGKTHEAIEAVHDLVDSGQVPPERVLEALRRVQELKHKFVGSPALPELEYAKQMLKSNPHQAFAQKWA